MKLRAIGRLGHANSPADRRQLAVTDLHSLLAFTVVAGNPRDECATRMNTLEDLKRELEVVTSLALVLLEFTGRRQSASSS